MKESKLKQGYYENLEQDISMSEFFKSVFDPPIKYVIKLVGHFFRNIGEYDSS
jgi:hypothetical protein